MFNSLSEMFNSLYSLWLAAQPAQTLPPKIVITLVSVFVVIFLLHYVVSSIRVNRGLKGARKKIQSIDNSSSTTARLDALQTIFSESKLLHLWQEYKETLHKQYDVVGGQKNLTNVRATVNASTFFTSQATVDTPLSTEFYKHLPGILTGIGIVGTFFGLIWGLVNFDPSTPEKVNESVDHLLKDVMFAFIGSAISIVASIIVTGFEKWRLSACYKSLEQLNEEIDAMFESGVGEEYLAELVKSSQENSAQTRQLKDSLVTDLREMLQNLVDSQARENLRLTESLSSSYKESGQLLADQVSGAIENSLKEPLEKISNAVQTASGDQSGQVKDLLSEVLTAFMAKLDTTFGQQFNGLSELLSQSVNSIQSMQQGFDKLVREMRDAGDQANKNSAGLIQQLLKDMQLGQNAMQESMNGMLQNLEASIARIGTEGEGVGERLSQQLEKMFAESELRQQAMADSLQQFVANIQQSVGTGQQQTMEKIASAVETLDSQLNTMFDKFEHNRTQMDRASSLAQVELHRSSRELMGGLEQQVASLLSAVEMQNNGMADTVQRLAQQTERTINGMQQGAEKMQTAADRFDTAGNQVAGVFEQSAAFISSLQNASVELETASSELGNIVGDYRNNRDSISNTLAVLEQTIKQSASEADTRSQYLKDLARYTENLQAQNQEVQHYLDRISDVLSESFTAFSSNMDRRLDETNAELDKNLSQAIKSLAGGVESVKECLEDFSAQIQSER